MPQIGKNENQANNLNKRLPADYVKEHVLTDEDKVLINRAHDGLGIPSTLRRRLLAIEKGRELSARYRGVVVKR